MNFIKRVGVIVYMLLMLAVGISLLLLSLGIVTPDSLSDALYAVGEDIAYQVTLGVIGAIFIIVGIIAPYRIEKKLKKNRVVSFQNQDGEVSVSLSAIEEYIRKIAKGIPGIKDIKPRVDINKKGIDIITNLSMSAGANIPEVTERIQMEVRSKVQGMLGVEETININVNIDKITGSGPIREEMLSEEAQGETQVPFREIE